VELFSPHPLFSVEFITGIWFLSFVAASDTQPEPNNMNKYENKIVNLTLAAFDGIESSTDVVVYAVVSYMSMAVLRLHSTSVNRMAIEDAVLTALEKKGVEVHH